jgi:hypothetical protein
LLLPVPKIACDSENWSRKSTNDSKGELEHKILMRLSEQSLGLVGAFKEASRNY